MEFEVIVDGQSAGKIRVSFEIPESLRKHEVSEAACVEVIASGAPLAWDCKGAVELHLLMKTNKPNDEARLYTCRELGGVYEYMGDAYGRWSHTGAAVIVYRDTNSDDLLYASVDEFGKRMKPLQLAPVSLDMPGADIATD